MFQSVMLVIFALLLMEDVTSFCTNVLKHKVNILSAIHIYMYMCGINEHKC